MELIMENLLQGGDFVSIQGGKPSEHRQSENFYHGFVLGLISDLRGLYIVTSNRESGNGRYDIMLEPVPDGYDGIIIEFKVFDPGRETSLEDKVESALKQIEEKKYETSLILSLIHI